jgi:rhodanese-related sulfurtransferase
MDILTSSSPSGNCKGYTPADLQARLSRGEPLQVIDVREYPEYAAGRIGCARLAPLGRLSEAQVELDRAVPVICVCRSGKRSAQAAAKLAELGFKDIAQLEGGLLAWEQAGFPLVREAQAPWPLERQVRLAAGTLVLVGLALSLLWPWAVGLSWFIGGGLVFAAFTDWCGMGLLLAKAPWNKQRVTTCKGK